MNWKKMPGTILNDIVSILSGVISWCHLIYQTKYSFCDELIENWSFSFFHFQISNSLLIAEILIGPWECSFTLLIFSPFIALIWKPSRYFYMTSWSSSLLMISLAHVSQFNLWNTLWHQSQIWSLRIFTSFPFLLRSFTVNTCLAGATFLNILHSSSNPFSHQHIWSFPMVTPYQLF